MIQMEVADQIVSELRRRLILIINENIDENQTKEQFIDNIFNEIDRDGSGYIDRDELRELLRKLEFTFRYDSSASVFVSIHSLLPFSDLLPFFSLLS